MWGYFDNCVGDLVICVYVFTVFCIVCTVFLYCFVNIYIYIYIYIHIYIYILIFLSVLV